MHCRRAIPLLVLMITMTAASSLRAVDEVLEQANCSGGVVVYVSGKAAGLVDRLIALKKQGPYVVCGLTRDRAAVSAARKQIKAADAGGRVTVECWQDGALPFIVNSVNLLVCADGLSVPQEEALRVLVPNGVLLKRDGGGWKKTVKPRPKEIDEWTHFLRGPDNNAVANDSVVGVPYHVQWVADPKWARHHNFTSSTSSIVSSGGRLFAIVDEGPVVSIDQRPQWKLIARDAFNGVILWKRKIGPWIRHTRGFRSGPAEIARRLIAKDDRVYVTPGYGKPVTALDAATGKAVRAFEGSEDASEICLADGRLHFVIGKHGKGDKRSRGAAEKKRIRVVEAASGKLLWEKNDAKTHAILPTAMCVSGGNLYFKNLQTITCLDAATGEKKWSTPSPSLTKRVAWGAPTLVVKDNVVLCADRIANSEAEAKKVTWTVTSNPRGHTGSELIALNASNGEKLWSLPCEYGYCAPTDVLVINGTVWLGTVYGSNQVSYSEGRDLRTGKVKVKLDTAPAFTKTHHHRCYRNKATNRFIILGRTGVEFIGLDASEPQRHCWIRGACQYGVLPCNGLLYIPPHACACYIQSKMTDFNALAPKREMPADPSPRLLKGPAFEDASARKPLAETDWPTFRGNAARTGATAAKLPGKLKQAWSIDLEGRLTAPVAAGGMVVVAEVDAHAFHAIEAASGGAKWQFIAGGRVDSPPTLFGGRAFFGCADGYAYALRLSDGALAWRFRAAQADRRIIVRGQLESVWPVTGSVLIEDGKLYCTAGRSSFLDGGMSLIRLDPKTGELIAESKLYSRDPKTGKQPEEIIDDVELPGAQPDVLASTGKELFLRDRRMDFTGKELKPTVPHIYSPVGYLDDDWWHRTYWIYGTQVFGRASGWAVAAKYVPSGRLLVEDVDSIYGFGRATVNYNDRSLRSVKLRLFRSKKKLTPLKGTVKNRNVAIARRLKPTRVEYHWTKSVPIVVRGMALTADALVIAGPIMPKGAEPVFRPGEPAKLMTFDPKTGAPIGNYKLESQPVLDGVIAAGNRLYMTTQTGKVECWGGE